MDRIISLLAALVGLIALGGAILVHVNADTQRAEMAAEIAQIKASVGISSAGAARSEVATATPTPAIRIPSAEHLASTPSSEPTSSAAAEPAPSTSPLPSVASAPEPQPAAPSAAVSSLPTVAPLTPTASASAPVPDVAAQLAALQTQISELEQANKDQASQLAAAQAQLASHPAPAASSEAPAATADLSVDGSQPAVHADATVPAAVLAADGPTKDCIPLGTRFMGSAGDSFPLCKTKMVLKVAAVSDGLATITGPGDVAAGATVPYGNGCLLAVFSADTTGFAEMRVSCQ